MKLLAPAALAAACMGQALAQPPATPDVYRNVAAALSTDPSTAAAPVEETADPAAEAPLAMDQLADLRGGEIISVQQSNQNLNAVNAGNSVSGHTVDSGAMNINANAFNGYDGIGNFVINTGHNNNLMGSVSVNVMVTPQ